MAILEEKPRDLEFDGIEIDSDSVQKVLAIIEMIRTGSQFISVCL
jgi:hypothetical protein